MARFFEISDVEAGIIRIDMDHVERFKHRPSDGDVEIHTNRKYDGRQVFFITPKQWEEAQKLTSNP